MFRAVSIYTYLDPMSRNSLNKKANRLGFSGVFGLIAPTLEHDWRLECLCHFENPVAGAGILP